MGKPITTAAGGVCFAFPDVCKTPVPLAGPVPIPYPNVGMLEAGNMENISDNVKASGNFVVRKDSSIKSSTGDEAGTQKGVKSSETSGEVKFTNASTTVMVNGEGMVRMFDPTTQNKENAVGVVLSGVPTVLVGD
jgi:hypothetical protein